MVVGEDTTRRMAIESLQLKPGERFWVNDGPDGDMIGGIILNRDGTWNVYSEDVTDAADGWFEAFNVLVGEIIANYAAEPDSVAFGREDVY